MGGPDALITVEESANKVLAFVKRVNLKDSGTFRSEDGDVIPY